jgi:hypothetical protein
MTTTEVFTNDPAETIANTHNRALLRLASGGWALALRSCCMSPARGLYVTHYIVERFGGEADEAMGRFERFKVGLS